MAAARICDGCGKAEKLAATGPAALQPDSGLPHAWVTVYVSSKVWMDPPRGDLLDVCSVACAGAVASNLARNHGARPGAAPKIEAP